jgi:hypothetical protein
MIMVHKHTVGGEVTRHDIARGVVARLGNHDSEALALAAGVDERVHDDT